MRVDIIYNIVYNCIIAVNGTLAERVRRHSYGYKTSALHLRVVRYNRRIKEYEYVQKLRLRQPARQQVLRELRRAVALGRTVFVLRRAVVARRRVLRQMRHAQVKALRHVRRGSFARRGFLF